MRTKNKQISGYKYWWSYPGPTCTGEDFPVSQNAIPGRVRRNLRKALVFLANVVIESDKQGPMSPQTLEFSQIFFYTHTSRFCTHLFTWPTASRVCLVRFPDQFEPPREELQRSKINYHINFLSIKGGGGAQMQTLSGFLSICLCCVQGLPSESII